MARNVSTIYINARAEKVWAALSKPELVKQWQYGCDLITDWKVGSDIKFSASWEGKVFEQWGKVLEITPNRIIRYSLFAPRPDLADLPENYFMMSYILTEEGEGIKLEIIQDDNRPGAVQEDPQGEENPVLKGLKSLIETIP